MSSSVSDLVANMEEAIDCKIPIHPAVNKEITSYGVDSSYLTAAEMPDRPPLNPPHESMPLFKKNKDIRVTNCETLIHLMKGNIGTGVLAMPQAFLYSGLWVGFAGVPIMGVICIHCMHMLVNCSRHLSECYNIPPMSYEETAETAFKYGPERLRGMARTVRYITTTFLIITQLGFCCVYYVFVQENLNQAFVCMTDWIRLTRLEYMLIIFIPLLLVCYIPNLKYLAYVSSLAAIAQACGLAITFYYMVHNLPIVENPGIPSWAGFSNLPMFFGSAMFAFEGISLVLPLEIKMKTPQAFTGAVGVLNTGMTLVVILYTSVGYFGYLQYGDQVQGSITLNLPPGETLAQVVKILMSAALFMSYPLQLYVPIQLAKPFITKHFTSTRTQLIIEYVLRTACVTFTFALAYGIPNIGLFISLVGAISSSALALILPPIIDMVTFWSDTDKYHWRMVKGCVICVIGLLGFVTGTLSSVSAIVEFFKNGSQEPPFSC